MYNYNNLLNLHAYYNEKEGSVFNQREFAEKLGINASKLSLLESGKKEPSLNEAKAYRRLTGASLDYIYGFSEHMEKMGDGMDEVRDKIGVLMDIAGNNDARVKKSMNHLLGTYECVAFFKLLDALWQTESGCGLGLTVSEQEADAVAQCLLGAKNPVEAYSIRCKTELLIYAYIRSHPYDNPDIDEIIEPPKKADEVIEGLRKYHK